MKEVLVMRYLLSVLVPLAFVSFYSVAQEDDGKVEKINVIGSHIKRTSMEGPSPLLVIDREQIEMSGYNSLGDVLRDLPTASLGGQRETSLTSNSATMTTSLRGMKHNDILVLINGRRMSPIGGSNMVDLSIIPLSSIEKIEILKDGASSLYGSDAIGGVINVVTKKGYVGGQVNIQGSLVQRQEGNNLEALSSFMDFWNWDDVGPSSLDNSWAGKGDKISIDATYGGNHNDINYLVGGQMRFNSPMYLRDREFGKPELDFWSTWGSPGSWNDDGSTWQADPNCPKKRIQDGQCKFDYSPYMQFMPQVFQGSAFAQADNEIGDSIFTATALYSFTRSFAILAPPPQYLATPQRPEDISTEKDHRIPQATAQAWKLSASGPIELKYRLVNEPGSGPRHSVLNMHYYQLQAGMITPLKDTMEFDVYANVSGSHYFNTGTSGWANRKILLEMANKNPTEFNPFLPDDKKSDVSKAIYKPTLHTHSNLLSVEPKLTGEIMSTNDHALSFATGGLGAWQRYNQVSDPVTRAGDQWGGGGNSEGEGSRLFSALYGELSLLSYEMVELQLAARMDYYSDFGLTEQVVPFNEESTMPFSPRAAISFQPIDEVKLRASWSMGFKAPTLESIHLKELITHPFGKDPILCPSSLSKEEQAANPDCKTKQYVTVLKGNKNLQPELSQSFNLGIVFEPVKNMFFSVDYFRTSQSELIVEASSDTAAQELVGDIFTYEAKYGAESLKEIQANVIRDANNRVKMIEISPSNQSSYKVHGVDLSLGFSTPINRSWDLGVKVDHSHLLYVERQAFKKSDPETPVPAEEWMEDWFGFENAVSDLENRATLYKYPRWRNTVTLSAMNKDLGHSVQFVLHNIPSQLKSKGSEDPPIDHYWQLDLAGVFSLDKKTSLTVGIRNLFGAERPRNDQDFGSHGYIASELYSVRGRTLDARLTYNFQ